MRHRWRSPGLLILILAAAPAAAQDRAGASPTAHNGAGVFHGNYCGVGDRGVGRPPTDALDRACMHHDGCTPEGGLPSCACNARFQRETHAVATSRRQPKDLRDLAKLVEASIPVIPCR